MKYQTNIHAKRISYQATLQGNILHQCISMYIKCKYQEQIVIRCFGGVVDSVAVAMGWNEEQMLSCLRWGERVKILDL